MTVSLPSSLEDFVRHKVEAGDFQSPEEVICEGLRLLQRQEKWKAEARQKISVGWEQAQRGQLRTPAQVRKNLAARKKSWKRENGRG